MKTRRFSAILLIAFGLALYLGLSSCKKKEQEGPELLHTAFYLEGNKVSVRNQAELNHWVEQYLKDGTEIQSAEFRYSEEGKFHYLQAIGLKEGRQSNIGIPIDLEQPSTAPNNGQN